MTQTCVSLSTGTISPDQRVNYAYGMVLGVDEFLTEQQHRLHKSALHERALHGFGTVYGLQVSTERAPDAVDDVQVTVATGMAIDQHGREIMITKTQCARLGAWLAAQEQASPGTVASHRGPSGELTVYVVARYDSCLDALVPLPGTPCSSSADISVASRIRDAWDVDLTFDRPAMPRWDTDRRLARLLSTVQIVAGLAAEDSDEEQIIDAILALPAQADDGPDDLWPDTSPPSSPPTDTGYRLPAETAADALDRIFTVWVTQVRPLLDPELSSPDQATPSPSDPGSTEAILLSAITFLAADPFDTVAPVISAFAPPDDTGRPYLLHTGLIQELRSLDQADTVVVRPRELVTLSPSVDPSGLVSLDAWFHLPRPVSLPEQVEVATEAGVAATFSAFATDAGGNPVDFADRWQLTGPAGFRAADGEQLQATFDGATVLIGDAGDNLTLEALQQTGTTLLNARAGGTVLAYATVEIDQVGAPPQTVEQQASVEFVTITSSSLDDKQLQLELWFHPQPRGPRDDVFVDGPVVEAFDEISGRPLRIRDLQPDPNYRNVWTMITDPPVDHQPFPAYVRLLFRAKDTKVDIQGGGASLAEWIDKGEILFVGWDPNEATIVAFSRVAGVRRP
jgi:hypothetical protein